MADLNEAMIFVAAVDAGSFAGAGRARGLTRSAIAKAIARLELRLGVRLIHRTTRSISLTDEGRSYYDRCCQILADLEETEASLRLGTLAPRGMLKLTVPDAFGRRCVLPVLYDFIQRWPWVEAEVNFSDNIVDMVEEGFDLALRIGASRVENHLISRVVARYRAVVCASPAYLSAREEPKTFDDLSHHDCLVFSTQSQRQKWRFKTGEQWGDFSGKSRLWLGSGEAICSAALAGMGIACLPSFLVDDDIAQGNLVPLLQHLETESIPVCAIYSSKRHLSPRIRAYSGKLAR